MPHAFRPRASGIFFGSLAHFKLPDASWIKIRALFVGGLPISMIAVRFGVERSLIWKGLKANKGSNGNVLDQRTAHQDKDSRQAEEVIDSPCDCRSAGN